MGLMTPSSPHMTIALSEDVQDVMHVARKLAQKDPDAEVKDRHILAAIGKLGRLFTRLDALLKHAHTSPKQIKTLLKQASPNYPPYTMPSTLLQRAQAIAEQDPTQPSTPRIEIEHLLMALPQSPDPLVQAIIQHEGLTPDRVMDATVPVNQRSTMRMVLYLLRESLEVIVVVLFLIIVFRNFVGELRLIPSESMVPSLQIGDRVVVEHMSHWFREPERGDILVFYPPEPQTTLNYDPWSVFLRLTGFSGLLFDKDSKIDVAYIKRVVGVPGDRLQVLPGLGLLRNGKLLKESYINEIAYSCGTPDFCRPFVVPTGNYFMMGDNRNRSMDSRYWGFLPKDRIIGRAVFRIFPIDSRFGFLPAPDVTTLALPEAVPSTKADDVTINPPLN